MSLKHLVLSKDISKEGYHDLLRRANKFVKDGISPDLMKGKVLATLFLQPSTRTMSCLQSAIIRAGGGWIGTSDPNALSMGKGESLEDTIKSFADLSDIIAIRHPDEDSSERSAAVSSVPIMNGGSGSKEHAMGGIMSVVKIYQYLGRIDNLKIGFYGTPGINRSSKSVIPILGHFNAEIMIDDLGCCPLPKEVEEQAIKNGAKSITYGKLDDFISEVDYLIVTRGLQKGIIKDEDMPKGLAEKIMERYVPINIEHMKKLRKDAFLDMYTPRIFEIEKEVDNDPRSIYYDKSYFTESALALMTYLLDIDVK